ncbi:FtsX-like permease family protein [Nocardiopsis sp. NPDC006198]|uniref:ABC transporter permease n=1 Tax=Nocardiopsis sp. NPDC006198 TaxID=3154472 RepID=UPI0033AF5B12
MIRLVLRGVADRARPLVLSVLTVALGAGLAVAALSLQGSADRVAAEGAGVPWRLSEPPIVVVAVPEDAGLTATPSGEPARLPPATVEALAGVPGVAETEVEAPFPAYVVTDERTLGDQTQRSWGHSWALAGAEPLTLAQGLPPGAQGEVALDAGTAADAGVAPGDRTRVLTPEGTATVLVTGIVDRDTAGGQDRGVFFTPGEAAARGGDPVLAAVWPREGADPSRLAEAIREEVPQVRVLTGVERSEALAPGRTGRELASGMGRFLGTVSGLVLAVAAVMVAGLLTTTVRNRVREFALLRLAGAGPGLVRRLVLGEALVLGAVAAVLSWVAGALLALLMARFFEAMGVLPPGFEPEVGLPALAAGTVLALAVPLLASWAPARAAGRTAPVEAMRAAQVASAPPSRVRVALGGVVLGGAVALLAVAWAAAGSRGAVVAALAASMVLVLAAALLAPVLVRGVLRLAGPLASRGSVPFLVHREAYADTRRVAGVMTPLMVTTAVACVLLFQGPTTSEARMHSYGERLAADLVVSGSVGVGLPETAAETAAGVPGVSAAGGFRQTVTAGTGASLTTYLVDPGTVADLYRIDAEQGAWEAFDADGVALDAGTAGQEGWRVGDTVTLSGPDGQLIRARVAVLYEAGLDFPEVLLPRQVLAPRMLDAMESAVYVTLDPGADPAAVARRLEGAIDAGPGILVTDRPGHLADVAAQGEGDDWITYLMVAVVAGFAGIGAVNTLVVSVAARKGRFALLRLVGASRGQVAGMVAAEALAVSSAAVALGTAAALAGLAASGYAFTGDTVVLSVAPGRYALLASAVLALGLSANLAPVAAALRARPLHVVSATG